MRNWVLREGNIFAQGHTVSRWQSQDWDLDRSVPTPVHEATCHISAEIGNPAWKVDLGGFWKFMKKNNITHGSGGLDPKHIQSSEEEANVILGLASGGRWLAD